MAQQLGHLDTLNGCLFQAVPKEFARDLRRLRNHGLAVEITATEFPKIPARLRQWVDGILQMSLHRATELWPRNRFVNRAVGILSNSEDPGGNGCGRLFVGVPRENGNPPQRGNPLYGAMSAYLASGAFHYLPGTPGNPPAQHQPIQAIFDLDLDDENRAGLILPIPGFERSAICPLTARETVVANIGHNWIRPFHPLWNDLEAAALAAHRFPPRNRADIRPVVMLETRFDGVTVTDALQRELRHHLAKALGNSFSNGRSGPATKGHAAAHVRIEPDGKAYAVIGVNYRHKRDEMICCSENMAADMAAALGWGWWNLTAVYSPDYMSSAGENLPRICGVCLGILAEHFPPDGDLITVCMNGSGAMRCAPLRELLPHPYAKVEQELKRA